MGYTDIINYREYYGIISDNIYINPINKVSAVYKNYNTKYSEQDW
jgi:hypothetical protein